MALQQRAGGAEFIQNLIVIHAAYVAAKLRGVDCGLLRKA
jgi:hypothetical protein